MEGFREKAKILEEQQKKEQEEGAKKNDAEEGNGLAQILSAYGSEDEYEAHVQAAVLGMEGGDAVSALGHAVSMWGHAVSMP